MEEAKQRERTQRWRDARHCQRAGGRAEGKGGVDGEWKFNLIRRGSGGEG